MQKDLFTRLISGLLATSMVLSMVTSSGLGYVNASAHEDDPPPGQEQIDKDKDNTVSEDKENSEPVEIAMPLELDKSAIGFSQGMESVEVTATMTDVQYLGVLSMDEYASFFPVELNLSKVDYLNEDQKNYINSMSEADRAASRSAALAKLRVKEQFIWEAAYDGKSYDDSILIEPIAFGVREATEDRAPSMTARVKISWIGETPVVESTSSMLSQMTGTSSSSGSKSIADEDPAIQDFLYEMWQSGGLTQENSDYDLSYFTNGTYKPGGASTTVGTQGTSFNLMGSSSTSDGAAAETQTSTGGQTTSTDPAADAAAQQTDDKTQGEVNSDVTTTNNTLENMENEEKAVLVDSVSGTTNGTVSTENESSLSGAVAGLFDRVGSLASYMMSAVTGTTTTTSQVAEAAAQTEGGDETTAEGEKQSEETGADELDIPTAYFGVRIKSNESIQTYGVGYYVGGTSVAAETGDQKDATSNNNETDNKTESGENAETGDKTETPATSEETTKSDSKTESATGETTTSKPATSTGPSAPVQSVADMEATATAAALTAMMNDYWSTDTTYEIRMTVDETEDASTKLQALVGGACNEAHYRVLDTRVATVDENGLVTALNEGNTKVVLYAYDAGWTPVMAEVNLTVRGKYTLSSQDKTAPEAKRVVPMVASGMTASLALKADGTVWGWGNDDGILKATEQGSNSYNNPAQIVLSVDEEFVPMTGIVKISVGFNYALALKADGTVYSWGVNTSGQLGNGMISDKTQQYPEYVMDGMAPLSGVVDISAGGSHSLALLEDGRVMAWGSNGTAQLGKGDYSDNAAQPVFVQWALGDLSGIVQVAAGGSFSVALAYDGTVYAWGDNRRGQMGNGKDGSLDYYVVKAEVVDIRDKNQQLRRAVDIAASRRIGQAGMGSYGHVLALTIPDFCDSRDVVWDTAVYGWGYNEYCAVRGIYKTTSSGSTLDTSDVRTPTLVEWASGNQPGLIVDVEAGNDHSLARDVNGRLYGWGYNNQGRVGVGTEAYSSGSTAKVEDPTQMWTGEVKEGDKLKNDGYVGDAGMEAIAMSAGDAFTVVLMRDGSVYSVGDNSANQLGTCGRALGGYGNNERTTGILVRTGDLVDRYILMNKVIVYTKQMMANGETAFVATSRYAERPGMFNETSELASLTELQLPKELTITDSQYIKVFKEGISRFYEVGFNLSERDRGNAYTEEDNEILRYRVDPMGIVDLEEEVTTNDVKAFPHMLTETDYAHGDTEFYVAEDNADPYEGGFNIHVKDADNFTTPALKAGDGFMVALKSDGTVYAWGDNTYGQLGNGDPTLARSVGPVQVVGADGPDGMKLILVEEISVGGSHVLARAGDGSVYAWGRNHVGQLGDGTREDRFYPVRVKNSSGNGYMAGATSVAAGGEHSLATLAKGDGYVYAWGGNDRGQLGLGWEGTGEEKVLYSSLPQFVSSGEGDPMTDVEKVYAGYKHSAAMGKAIPSDKYNVLKAWGDNTYGQVGVGQQEPYIYVPADVATNRGRLDNVVDAALGAYHTVAMTRNDLSGVTTVYMGGRNEEGQLGRTEALVNGGGGIVYNMSPLLEFWGMNHTNEPVKDAIRLSAGKDHTIILRGKVENGDEIYTGAMLFGGDTYRQLGMGTEHKEYGEEGELLFRYRELSVVEAGSLESITAGWETTSVIDREGRVYTWGKNDDGELGEFSLLGGEAVNNPGNDEAWIPNVDSVLVDPNAQYTLSVTVQKDGVVWGDSGKEFTLVGGTRNNVVMVESKVETENGSKGTGLYTAQVSAGTYTLYEGTINRGEVVAAYNRLDQKVLNYVPVEISLMKWADDAWAAWTDSKKQLSLRDSSAVNADDDIPMTELDKDADDVMDGVYTAYALFGAYGIYQADGNKVADVVVTEEDRTFSINFREVCVNFNGISTDGKSAALMAKDQQATFKLVWNIENSAFAGIVPTNASRLYDVCDEYGTTGQTMTVDNINEAVASVNYTTLSIVKKENTSEDAYVIVRRNGNVVDAAYVLSEDTAMTVAMPEYGTASVSLRGEVDRAYTYQWYVNEDDTLVGEGATYELSKGNFLSDMTLKFFLSVDENGVPETGDGDVITDETMSNLFFMPSGDPSIDTEPPFGTGNVAMEGRFVTLNPGDNLNIDHLTENYYTEFRLRKHIKEPNEADAQDLVVYVVDSSVASVNRNVVTAHNPGQTIIYIYNKNTGRVALVSLRVNYFDKRENVGKHSPMISSGEKFALALKTDGTVWSWGDNEVGQLGNNDSSITFSVSPVQVKKDDGTNLESIVYIAAGYDHALALAADGTLYAWGDDTFAQQGRGTDGAKKVFAAEVVEDAPENLVALAAGNDFSLLLDKDGYVYGFGRNDKGQTGVGYTLSNLVPVPHKVYKGASVSDDENLAHIVKIVAGESHALALRADSAVFGWGDNGFGQLGTGIDSGLVENETGSQNRNETFNYRVPFQLLKGQSESDYAVEQNGKLMHIVDIAAGAKHSLVLDKNGMVFAFGSNEYGQLGQVALATEKERASDMRNVATKVRGNLNGMIQIAAGANNSAAVAENYRDSDSVVAERPLYVWGSNSRGQLGKNKDVTSLPYVDVPTLANKGYSLNTNGSVYFTDVRSLAMNGDRVVALREDGYVWNWGAGEVGQIGNGLSEDALVPVMVGDAESKVLGLTEYFVGDGTTMRDYHQNEPMGDKNPSQIRMGTNEFITFDLEKLYYHQITGFNLLSDGAKINLSDMLSNVQVMVSDPDLLKVERTGSLIKILPASTNPKLGSVTVSIAFRGDYDGKQTTNYVIIPVHVYAQENYDDADEDNARTIPMLAAGNGFSVGLTTYGEVYTWGINTQGQLGNKDTAEIRNNVLEPTRILEGLVNSDKEIYFTAIAAGEDFALALDNEGHVWSWGSNEYSQLGNGIGIDKTQPFYVVPQQVKLSQTTLLGDAKTNKQYTNGDTGVEREEIVAIAAGSRHALALSKSGLVYAWGSNEYGQLGIRDESVLTSAYAVRVLKGVSPSETMYLTEGTLIATGGDSSYVVRRNGTVFAFGRNDQGQLGCNTRIQELAPVQVTRGEANTDEGYIDQITAIAAGNSHAVVQRVSYDDFGISHRELYGWGENNFRQLGTPASATADNVYKAPVRICVDGVIQIAAGYNGTMAQVKAADDVAEVLAWGANDQGQMGVHSEIDTVVDAVVEGRPVNKDGTISTDKNMEEVWVMALGKEHSLISRGNGMVYAMGDNTHGQLGDYTYNNGYAYPVLVGDRASGSLVVMGAVDNYNAPANPAAYAMTEAVVTANSEMLVLNLDEMKLVYSLGFNLHQHNRIRIAPSELEYFSLNSSLLAPMEGTAGKFAAPGLLGTGDYKYGTTYVVVRHAPTGTQALVKVTVKPSAEECPDYFTAPKVSVGKDHTVALMSDGTVWAWGANGKGQLGDDGLLDRAYPVQMTRMNDVDDPYGTGNYRIPFTKIVDVAAGDGYTMLLAEDGRVWVVGELLGVTKFNTVETIDVTNKEYINGVPYIIPDHCPRCGEEMGLDHKFLEPRVDKWDSVSKVQMTDSNGTMIDVTITPVETANGKKFEYKDAAEVVWTFEWVDMAQLSDPEGRYASIYREWDSAHWIAGENTASLLLEIWSDEDAYSASGYYVDKNRLGDQFVVFDSTTGEGILYEWKTVSRTLFEFHGRYRCPNTSCQLIWDPNSTDPFMCYYPSHHENITGDVIYSDVKDFSVPGKFPDNYQQNANGIWEYKGGANPVYQVLQPKQEEIEDQDYEIWYCFDCGKSWFRCLRCGAEWGVGETHVDEAEKIPMPSVALVKKEDGSELTGVTMMSAGAEHALFVDEESRVWSVGKNTMGQLGHNNNHDSVNGAAMVRGYKNKGFLKDAVKVAAGADFSAALLTDGHVYTWGSNSNGQSGHASTTFVNKTPVLVESGEFINNPTDLEMTLGNVVDLAAGERFALALALQKDHEGKWTTAVFGWGDNGNGQLVGDGSGSVICTTPVKVLDSHGNAIYGAAGVTAGAAHSAVLRQDGGVHTFGSNRVGQLGHQAGDSLMLRGEHTVSIVGNDTQMGGIAAADAGGENTVVMTADGRLLSMGWNENGQLGNATFGAGWQEAWALYVSGRKNTMLEDSYAADGSYLVQEGFNRLTFSTDQPVKLNTTLLRKQASGFNLWNTTVREENVAINNFYWVSSDAAMVQVIDGEIRGAGDTYSQLKRTGRVAIYAVDEDGVIYAVIEVDVKIPDQKGNLRNTVPMVAASESAVLSLKADGTVWYWGSIINDTANYRVYPRQMIFEDLAEDEYIVHIAAGVEHYAVLTSEGRVYIWGDNTYGQLGLYETTAVHDKYIAGGLDREDRPTIQELFKEERVNDFPNPMGLQAHLDGNGVTLPKIVDVVLGDYHTLLLDENGQVWAMGRNDYGQLGTGDVDQRNLPARVLAGTSSAIRQQDEKYNTTQNLYLSNIIALAAGGSHSVALRGDGAVFTWGSNEFGQLGVRGDKLGGNTDNYSHYYVMTTRDERVRVLTYHEPTEDELEAVAQKANTLSKNVKVSKRYGTVVPVQVQSCDSSAYYLENNIGIAAGRNHTLVLGGDGFAYAFGDNTYGQLGSGTIGGQSSRPIRVDMRDENVLSVRQVVAGPNHSLAVVEYQATDSVVDSALFAWGDNTYGQLGLIHKNTQGYATQVYQGGSISSVDDTDFVREVLMAAANSRVTIVVRDEGSVWVSGWNDTGMIGDGTTKSQTVLTQAGTGNYYALDVERVEIYEEATNLFKVAYDDNDPNLENVPTPIIVREDEKLYLDPESFVEIYGSGFNLIDAEIRRKMDLSKANLVYTSSNPTLADFQVIDGKTYMVPNDEHLFGRLIVTVDNINSNYKGDYKIMIIILPRNDWEDTMKVAPMVASGNGNAALLRADGTVWTWGNTAGASYVNPAQMVLPDLAADEYVVHVAAHNEHFLAITNLGSVYGWGDNSHGQLGVGDTTDHTSAVKLPDFGPDTALGRALDTAVGNDFSLVLSSDGKVYSFGSNEHGQLGIDDGTGGDYTTSQVVVGMDGQDAYIVGITSVAAGDHFALAIRNDASAFAWGLNDKGQLGIGNTTKKIVPSRVAAGEYSVSGFHIGEIIQISAGAKHVLARSRSGKVYAWGDNSEGQLGRANTLECSTAPILVNTVGKVVETSAGGNHSVARTSGDGTEYGNRVYSWGSNGQGQLGGNSTVAMNEGLVTMLRGDNTYFADSTDPDNLYFHGGAVVENVHVVDYHLGKYGVSADKTSEEVKNKKNPAHVPGVSGVNEYKFIGWSETDPETLKEGESVVLVDPTKFQITDDKVFYAVYEAPKPEEPPVVEPPVVEPDPDRPAGAGAKPGDKVGDHLVKGHIAYVKGYPDDTFAPGNNITRAEVATIIARACLDDFVEGAPYGNAGYNDVGGHWAQSAIAYCTMNNVFKGYEDGTFQPNKAISRQEFALVFARLVGLQSFQDVPFSDIQYAGSWALDGIYTAYSEGWVNGYTDGTFRPLNNITRAEAVKIVNRYLDRGVDEWGKTNAEPRTWVDVPKTYWAYYEIIEAANGHAYYYRDGKQPPENWTALWEPLH